jgi:hypothetical protein
VTGSRVTVPKAVTIGDGASDMAGPVVIGGVSAGQRWAACPSVLIRTADWM